jgi:tol-pal system protein YbgF
MTRHLVAAAGLFLLGSALTGCSGLGGFRGSGATSEELRARILELEKKAVVAELEIDRLRQKVAALEGPPRGGGSAGAIAPTVAPTPRPPVVATPTFEPQTRIPAPPAIDSRELPVPRSEPSSPGDEPARPLPAAALDPASVDARAEYDRAYALFHQGRYAESEAAFSSYLSSFAANDLSDNAIYWIGECRLARSDWNGALRSFQEAVERFPTGNKVPDALYKAGQALERLGDLDAARASYETVVERFPQSGAAERAAERLSALR